MNIKCLNVLKRTAAVILCAVIAACGVFAASAQSFTVTELDDMVITLPDNVSAITRQSKSTDKYFSAFGLDYDAAMQNFESSNIYLQGMDSGSTVTYTVTMTRTDESEKIGSYSLLSADEMTQVRNKFLNMGEYGTCTPDQSEGLVWLIFDVTVSSGGKQIKAYQANTVHGGMSVNITLKRNEGDVTADDYEAFSQVVSSVDFLKEDFISNILPYVIVGGTVVIILLIVLIAVLARRAKKRRKRHKNNAILEELASKYKLTGKNSGYSLDSFDESPQKTQNEPEPAREDLIPAVGEDYYEETADGYASDEEIDDIINTAKAYKKEAAAEYGAESKTENETESEDGGAYSHYEDISSGSKRAAEAGQEDSVETPEEAAEAGNAGKSEKDYTETLFGSDVSPDDDNESDEVLVREQARRAKFDSGYDFFEEAPKKTMGVLSSEEIRDAEDYDVINEVEQKAQRVKSEGKTGPGPAVVFLKKAGGGVKSFCIHFGYFCKNVSIMIKRKRAASKRKKAEQERRERARQRAERERLRAQRQRDGSDNGLVRVHTGSGAGGGRSRNSNSRAGRR